MKILFLHRNFPAQFRYLALELAKNPDNQVVFITNNDTLNLKGIHKIVYKTKRKIPRDSHQYLRFYEDSIIHAQGAAQAVLALKEQGFVPDIIYGHTWGQTLFMKDIYPEVPLVCFFEWFYNSSGADVGFDGMELNVDEKAKLRCKNSHILVDLYSCDAGIAPTNWQKNQFPKEFHDKIKVIHDGVDTDFCVPDENAFFTIKEKGITLSAKDSIVTYATRGMEPYRGFPEFMRAVDILLKKRPGIQVVVAGEDRVCYGAKLASGTYKEKMLSELGIDSNRIHFVGGLPLNEYVKLLQISSAHVYLTYPFVLSWSLLDAMAIACPIIASSTPPVLEVMKDGYDGLLTDFHNVNELSEKIEYALDNRLEMKQFGKNARNTVLNNYALKDMLPKQLAFLNSLVKN